MLSKNIYEFIDDISFFCDIYDHLKENDSSDQWSETLEEIKRLEKIAFNMLGSEHSITNGNIKVQVAVVGDFSSGKSSFINSLLGENICPVKVQPTTSSITKFMYGDKIRITQKKTGNISSETSDIEIPIDRYKEMSQHKSNTKTEVHNFDFYYPFEGFRDIVLYDTPGFNNPENKIDDRITRKKLETVDVILFVIDINKGEISSDMLKMIREEKQKNSQKEWYLILNKADTKPASAEKIYRGIKKNHNKLFNEVFLYSASDVLSKKNNTVQNAIDLIKKSMDKKISKGENFDISINGTRGRSNANFSLLVDGQKSQIKLKESKYAVANIDLIKLLKEIGEKKNILMGVRHKKDVQHYKKQILQVLDLLQSKLSSANKAKRSADNKYEKCERQFYEIVSALSDEDFYVQLLGEGTIISENRIPGCLWGYNSSPEINSDFQAIIRNALWNKVGHNFTRLASMLNFFEPKTYWNELEESKSCNMAKEIMPIFHSKKFVKNANVSDNDFEGAKQDILKHILHIGKEMELELKSYIKDKINEIKNNFIKQELDIKNVEARINKYLSTEYKVTFEIEYPASSICIAGDFNHWEKEPLNKNSQKHYAEKVLKKGRYTFQYREREKIILADEAVEFGKCNKNGQYAVIYV